MKWLKIEYQKSGYCSSHKMIAKEKGKGEKELKGKQSKKKNKNTQPPLPKKRQRQPLLVMEEGNYLSCKFPCKLLTS
jgi:hypothetical protein